MMGFTPVVYGNIKSLLDHRRTPETQKAFAEGVFQRPKHITSFADGTKIAAEMACVANATGFGVSERGMEGPECKRVEEAVGLVRCREDVPRGHRHRRLHPGCRAELVCSSSPTPTRGSMSAT